jgi:hypothetical protein
MSVTGSSQKPRSGGRLLDADILPSGMQTEETVQVWLVERTYGDDEQNLIILTYATPDGDRTFRKERALTSFTGDERGTTAALDVSETNLSSVDDPEKREQYAAEVRRMAEKHDPSETI